jgi:hypothetical protein
MFKGYVHDQKDIHVVKGVRRLTLAVRVDVTIKAIDFAKEQNDDDLWEDLLKYSMDKPCK